MSGTRSIAVTLALIIVGMLACAYVLVTDAHAARSSAVTSRVVCATPTEDALAHVRMVRLTHTHGTYHVTYRCVYP